MLEGKTILLIGATQGTGLEAAQILASEGAALRVFARNTAKARERLDGNATIIGGDLRDPDRLPEAFRGAEHVIFTAGVTKRPCDEKLIVSTEFEGMKKTLAAASAAGFSGRIAFLSSIGVTRPNWASRLLNKVKGNALKWRREMEDLIRSSGFDYSIVRAGYLMNSVSGKEIALTQREYALELRHRIGRREAARVLVEALKEPAAARKTFDAVRSRSSEGHGDWRQKFTALAADTAGEVYKDGEKAGS